jgi:hypothetical protein
MRNLVTTGAEIEDGLIRMVTYYYSFEKAGWRDTCIMGPTA